MVPYPSSRTERDAWIVRQRGERNPTLSAAEPYAFFVEDEATSKGGVAAVATLLLTNRECPWKCVMCDLWKNTLPRSVETGAIPGQIEFALRRLGAADRIKLYNSGSFFDRGAIPVEDLPAIAKAVSSFEKITVECHPALVDERLLQFRDLLNGRLEIAMGLETAHPQVLAKLNKGMSLEMFAAAAKWLHRNDIDLRTFLLLQPPFLPEQEAVFWACQSIDRAFEYGSAVVTVIPTRGGNGAMERLESGGLFRRPTIRSLENALEYGLTRKTGLVFADLWELEKSVRMCERCFEARRNRLHSANLQQLVLPSIECTECGNSA